MKTNLTYTNINGINYPNLHLPEQKTVTIGKYGVTVHLLPQLQSRISLAVYGKSYRRD